MSVVSRSRILLPILQTLNQQVAPFCFNKQLSSRIVIALFDYTTQQLYAATPTTQTPKNIRQRPEIMSKEKKEKKRKEPEPATIENTTKEEETKKVSIIRCFMLCSSTSSLSFDVRVMKKRERLDLIS